MPNPNTAVFPSAVAADNDVLVASDGLTTTLAAGITGTPTTFTVADGSKFTAPGLVTIDNEVIFVTSKSGNVLTVGTRGVAGTVAVDHASGAGVYCYVNAYYHNQVAAEIKAIEAALGINLGNVLRLAPALSQLVGGGSGSSTVTIKAGASQSTNSIFQVQDNSANALVAIDTSNTTIAGDVQLNTGNNRKGIKFVGTGSSTGRIFQAQSADGRLDITSNINFDGTNWQRDNVAKDSTVVSAWAGNFAVFLVAAGSNPAATLNSAIWAVNPASPRVLIGTSTDDGSSRLQVNGAGLFTGLIKTYQPLIIQNGSSAANQFAAGPFSNVTDWQIIHSTNNFTTWVHRFSVTGSGGRVLIGNIADDGAYQLQIGSTGGSNPPLALKIPIGATNSGTLFYTLHNGLSGGSARWGLGLSDDESGGTGGSGGSNIYMYRYSNGGSYLGWAYSVNRANGTVTFSNNISVTGNVACAGTGAGTYGLAVTSGRVSIINGEAFQLYMKHTSGATGMFIGTGSDGHYRVYNDGGTPRLMIASDGSAHWHGTDLTYASGAMYVQKTNASGLGPELILDNAGSTINETARITFSGGPNNRVWMEQSLDNPSAKGILKFYTGLYNRNTSSGSSVNPLSLYHDGTVQVPGTWSGGCLRMGHCWLWVNASTGKLYIKPNSAPTSDTDGTVVGTQT